MKTALITGITGQDGSYLAEFLLNKNYKVYGFVRRTSGSENFYRIQHLLQKIILIHGDLCDYASIDKTIRNIKPDEIYNLGAQSFVHASFDQPFYTTDATGLSVLRILEAIKNFSPESKFYQASSSEMFGKVLEVPQSEKTPFYPRSPYGIAKLLGHNVTVNYRESYNIFAVSGILFNHESPRRGEEFVTKKIAKAVARIKLGKQKNLVLGNLMAKRDWGFAGDYVVAMWLMLQQSQPKDYVIGLGETHSVEEFCNNAFGIVGLNWTNFVESDVKFRRPAEVDLLISDPSLAHKELKWIPKTNFNQLVAMIVNWELNNNGI